jgi:hypothetical protein
VLVAETVWVIVINFMLEMERRLLDELRGRYAAALEVKSREVGEEFGREREGLLDRSRRYREAIEQIVRISQEMVAGPAGAVSGSSSLAERALAG